MSEMYQEDDECYEEYTPWRRGLLYGSLALNFIGAGVIIYLAGVVTGVAIDDIVEETAANKPVRRKKKSA